MADEDEVQISESKRRLLDNIRNEGENNGIEQSNLGRGPIEAREGGFIAPPNRNPRIDRGSQGGSQGEPGPARIVERSSTRVRPSNRPPINPVESPRISDRGREEPVATQFKLKWPFAKKDGEIEKPTKLFSNAEAEREFEHMKDIYFRGSGFLDDILEIVVKDHEPVQIWQISEEEATMLAINHLDRAKVDEGAARSARVLLDIYDRIYFWMVVYPRTKLTYSHVRAHGGFSFK